MTEPVLWANITPAAEGARTGVVASPPLPFDAGIDPNERHPGMVWERVPVGVTVINGMIWDGTAFGPAPDPVLSVAQLLEKASASQDGALAGVFAFNVAASGQPPHVVTTRLDAKGQFAMVKVQGWLQLNASRPDAVMPYSNVDFSHTLLTVAEADNLVEQAAALDVRSYAILNQVAAGIQASPPTVTTLAQIRSAFAALTSPAD